MATSRTEGAHWLIKQDLQVSVNDLLVVLRVFSRAVNLQFNKVKHKIHADKIRKLTVIDTLYKLLVGRISSKAIQHTQAVFATYLPEGEDKPQIPHVYNCNSKETSGFPCIHMLKQYDDAEDTQNRMLKPKLFHQHWHLYSIDAAPPINLLLLLQDPLRVRRRGRPRGARNFAST
jgi:hypothetical protein